MLFIRYSKSLLTENQVQTRPIEQLDEIDQLASTLDANMAKELHVPKDVLDSFKLKDTLNPEIWNDFELNPKVRKKLIKIAHDFIKNLDLPKPIVIKDIIFTGSLANYNWSKFSDIDLHIITDFKQLESDQTLTKDYFNAKKNQWNQEHDITIFDYPVELYVQDIADKLVATAVYSVQNDKWLKKPIREKFTLDKKTIKAKAEEFISQLKDIREAYKKKKYNAVVKKVKDIKDKIKQMRKAGLESGGEFSNENLVFKVLRRTPFMDVLDSFKAKAYDQLMSVVEKIELDEAMIEEKLVDDVKFKSKKTEDGYELLAFHNNEEVASLVLDETTNGYWIFDGDLTQDEYDEIFPEDKFMQITHLSIPDPTYRGGGLARKLMTLAIQKSKKLGYNTIYLNASPIQSDKGLNLNDLVSFYESFGFNVFKHQGNNALMVLYLNKPLQENKTEDYTGSVVFILGETLEDGTRRLYATTIKNVLNLQRKKSDNSEGKPAQMAIFGNNEVFSIGMVDGELKALRVGWNSQQSMLKRMGLTKTSVTLNDNKTPAHWLSKNFKSVPLAVRELKTVLLSIPNVRWKG